MSDYHDITCYLTSIRAGLLIQPRTSPNTCLSLEDVSLNALFSCLIFPLLS